MKPRQPVIPTRNVADLLKSMSGTGFQGRKLGESVELWARMIRDEECTIFFGLSGAMIPAGMRFTEPDEVFALDDGLTLEIAGMRMRFAHTPGHTPGSIVATIEEEYLLSGDVLFAGSIGRTDLPLGSLSDMEVSLREKIIPLPDELEVLPGHGKRTTIGAERRNNPFLRAAMEGRLA